MTEPRDGATTLSLNIEDRPSAGREQPGLVVLFSNGGARRRVIRVERPLELGRLDFIDEDQRDPLVSRRHVRVELA